MNYYEWGNQYLKEAKLLHKRMEMLREELKTAEDRQEKDLLYRINILYSMYLELKHIGEFLINDRREK